MTVGRPARRTGERVYGSFDLTVGERPLVFRTQPGVFSADGPDAGSLLLLDSIEPVVKPHMKVLDLGCGVGLIGISLAAQLTRGEVWMVDPDVRAFRLTEENIRLNDASNAHPVLGDITRDLPAGLRFDLVLSNPPTHSGKAVLQNFVEESHDVLRPGGWMYVVVNRLLSIRAMMAETFGEVDQVARRKGFVVVRAQKARKVPS